MERTGSDDRAPLRRATWSMLESADWQRRVSGWGAGSYRWVSPSYLGAQPEFLNKRGELARRATHAHNDWLQAPVEWGLAGWVAVVGALTFIALRIRAQFRRPRAPALALLGVTTLFSVQLFFDFLLFTPQLVFIALLACWLQCMEFAEAPTLGVSGHDPGA